ncbi:MAG: ribonuclease P protein component [Candidatus Glassbacteria bacterium]
MIRRRSEALPRDVRITKKADFERAKGEGVWIRGSSFDLIFKKGPLDVTRLGIIVPLYSHKVVERNRLKRIVREVMRRFVMPEMIEPYDIVVKAKRNAYEADYKSIQLELRGLASKFREGRNGN